MTTLTEVWQEAARRWPDKVVVAGSGERLGARELGRRIGQMSAGLAAGCGVQPGDVVALLAPNCVELVVAYFAVTSLGAVVQPVDERLKADEIAFVLKDSAARCAIVHQAFWPRFMAVRTDLAALDRVVAIAQDQPGADASARSLIAAAPAKDPPAPPAPGCVAELMYTSGTTGGPKGVMRTHGNVLAASGNARRAFGYRHDDVIALAMPLSHSSALVSQMLPMLEVGGTSVLVERFDPASLLEVLAAERVSCLRAVPAMFRMLLACPRFTADALPSLRLLMNSSAAIDPATYLEVKERFPSVELVNSYGLTEASTCTILPDALARAHPASIGLPIEGVEMRVAGEDGREAPPGEEGELQVRGPHVFAGYRGLPLESDRAMATGGWLRTGDIGARDACGLFHFRGRRDDLINCGGRKYAPLEVENCILEMPDVTEAAVVGMPHRVLGNVARAFVVFRAGAAADPKAVSRHCARRLPSHKVPFKVEVLAALPRNSVGKVLHRTLRVDA